MRKLNITKDIAEDRKQWRQLIPRPTPGVRNGENDDGDFYVFDFDLLVDYDDDFYDDDDDVDDDDGDDEEEEDDDDEPQIRISAISGTGSMLKQGNRRISFNYCSWFNCAII